jgi:broad specificity phosphatase PhoE
MSSVTCTMLVLARHGECVANAERRYVGRSESPLTLRGQRQAARLAAVLAGDPALHVERVVASPLGRAVHTAEAIASALADRTGMELGVELDERFVEVDYGELDGEPIGDSRLAASWREDPAVPIPKGESLDEVAQRVDRACSELLATLCGPATGEVATAGRAPLDLPRTGDVLVVSHVLPIKLAVCWALGIPAPTVWRMNLAVASLTRIATGGVLPSLERYNEHDYLAEDDSPPIWR